MPCRKFSYTPSTYLAWYSLSFTKIIWLISYWVAYWSLLPSLNQHAPYLSILSRLPLSQSRLQEVLSWSHCQDLMYQHPFLNRSKLLHLYIFSKNQINSAPLYPSAVLSEFLISSFSFTIYKFRLLAKFWVQYAISSLFNFSKI